MTSVVKDGGKHSRTPIGEQKGDSTGENLSSDLREITRHKKHMREGSNRSRIADFLYPDRRADLKTINSETGIPDTRRYLERLTYDRLVAIEGEKKYYLTTDGRGFVLGNRLGLKFLELRLAAYAYCFIENLERMGKVSKPVFLISAYVELGSTYKSDTVRRAASKLVKKGYFKRLRRDWLTRGERYGELALYAPVLGQLYEWIRRKSEEEASRIKNDPYIRKCVLG